MSKLDKELITKKLQELLSYINKLEEFRSLDESTFVQDHHNYGLAEHYMQQSIEVILDIARHFVLALDLKMPDEPHGLLPLLSQKKVLTEDFVQRNEKISGFRNRLVHAYDEIDHEKTYKYLQEHLTDFQDFSKQVSSYLLKH